MNAAALVIGIDAYRAAPRLSGAVQDAIDAVNWLLSIGVPADRIHLHCAPIPDGVPVPARPATWEEIWDSICHIKEGAGDKLFVFMSGHGLYVPAEGAIFLTEEFSDSRRLHANIGVEAFAQYFLSFDYRDQVFVCDACQNPSNPATRRPRIEPRRPGESGWTPRDDTGLTLCSAAGQGQVAYLINGRGLLTRRLLAFLRACASPDPPREAQGAIVHDWLTGERTLDLRRAFERVAHQVQEEAAPFGVQTPKLFPRGRAGSESFSLVHHVDAGSVETAMVEVESGGLDYISLNLMPPVVELTLPLLGRQPPFPTAVKVPRGGRLVAECTPLPGWLAEPEAEIRHIPEGGLTVRFRLRRPPSGQSGSAPRPPTSPGGAQASVSPDDTMAVYRITLVDSSGEPQPAPREISSDLYEEIVDQLGAPKDITVEAIDNGVEIWFPIARLLAARPLAEALHRVLGILFQGDGLQAFLSSLSYGGVSGGPNVQVLPPLGGLELLAGYLVESAEIRFARVGSVSDRDRQTLALSAIGRQGFLRLGPGEWRARLELPWGSWEENFNTSEELARLTLPDQVGHAPLRNGLLVSGTEQVGALLFLPGERRGARPDSPRRQRDGTFTQDWRLGERFFRVPLGPFPGMRFLATTFDGTLKVEPWSDMPWPEWDMLVSAGRLEDVDLPSALQRLNDEREAVDNLPAISVLKLALAYAAHAQRRPDELRQLLEQLDRRTQATPDAKLLACAAAGEDRLSEAVALPLFRWGLPLLARFTPEGVAEAAIVPTSEWTVLEMTAALA